MVGQDQVYVKPRVSRPAQQPVHGAQRHGQQELGMIQLASIMPNKFKDRG